MGSRIALPFSAMRSALIDLSQPAIILIPVINNGNFTVTLPLTVGQVVGTMTATNNPTNWAITGGDPGGAPPNNDFAISSSGVITVTADGASQGASTVSLSVTATNAGGTSNAGTAAITIQSGATSAQLLLVGGGGYITGMSFANDSSGMHVLRTDTNGAYVWNPTAASPKGNDGSTGAWQQLINGTSIPAITLPSNPNGGITSSLPNVSGGVFEIQLAPSNSAVAYMLWGGYFWSSTNANLYAGLTWTRSTTFNGNAPVTALANDSTGYRYRGPKMAIDPNNPLVVYVGSENLGLFKTTDGGATWTNYSSSVVPYTGTGSGPTGICIDPSSSGTFGGITQSGNVYLACDTGAIMRTQNAGSTWARINSGSGPTAAIINADIAISGGKYYCVDNSNGNNGGNTWSYNGTVWTTEIAYNAGTTQGAFAVRCDPSSASHVIAIMAQFAQLNENNGSGWSGWSQNGTFSSADVPWLAATFGAPNLFFLDAPASLQYDRLTPGKLYAHSSRGVFTATVTFGSITTSTVPAWKSNNVGEEQLVPNNIVVGGAGVRVGCWDTPILAPSTTSYPTVVYPPSYTGSVCACWSIDKAANNNNFMAFILDGFYGGGPELSCYSTDGGLTFNNWPSKPAGVGSSVHAGSISVSTSSNIIWAPCGTQPFFTLNGGTTWTGITLPGSPSWTGFQGSYYNVAKYVCADQVNTGTFYLINPAGNSLYITTNGGSSWTLQSSSAIFQFLSAFVRIKAVPNNAGYLWYLNTSDPVFATSSAPPYFSTNFGATWNSPAGTIQFATDIGFGIGPAGGTSFSVYLAGQINGTWGIYRSNNNGTSWTLLVAWPYNDANEVLCISGDPVVYGRVYLGEAGGGFRELNYP